MTFIGNKSDLKVVGTRPVRPDGVEKVTGRAAFGADMAMPGMLVGKIKRSPHAHARILSIDTDKALALPGVKAVVTATDFPDIASEEAFVGEGPMNFRDLSRNCMARDKALYEGHAVAAVAATSSAIADAALDLIEVHYEVLPHVIDVEAAMAPGAPLLHDDLFTQNTEPAPAKPSNIAKRVHFRLGDIAAGFREAEVVVDGRFTTQPVHQAYIEPHACIASVGADGQSQLWGSSQGQFMVRAYCAKLLGMEISNLRVIPAEIGGGFGGKTVVYLEPLALALSRKSGRPVKMVMTREEVFRASGPTSGGVVEVKIGARKDGTITAAQAVLKFQAGAFPGSPVQPACMCAFATYDLKNVDVTGYDVVSNRPKVAAYRAPGAPIAAFAVESAMDDLARKLGMDPIALREKNAAKAGTKTAYGPVFPEIGYQQTLAAARNHPHYKAPLGPNQGRGVATGFWFNIGGESSAAVYVNEDGSVNVVSGSPDIGGSRASMAMMAAEVLGIPVEHVRPIVADTASVGFTHMTGGSRVTYATGMATVQAAEKVVEQLKQRAAMIWDIPPDAVEWKDGEAVPAGANAGGFDPLPLAAIALKAGKTGGPIGAEVSLNAQGAGPGFGAHICDVEVDRETGYVKILRYTAVQDVGRAIHPGYVEGQIQGGATQGIGWALNEEYVYDAKGRMDNAGFLDYRVPVASDLPMIDAVLVEVPNTRHPFGVRGVGEVPIVPPTAAVGNAIRDALGIRMHHLPMSPPKVRAAVDTGSG
ncbi:xanthine dehydrogenase family protein molybdopterin-binding subunit [Limobrevibacterium gyesilva]|uniref:Xanthine dehydrogenase family protein molybdopterin-binding subunit n=1 Tax=Limobrevibacterium gyesilva TaxID=2991712 RepID=A0AA41YMP1_9PROT|nr:xanthine dehydrogenase family protein molybdopterin-binding subunit [Limobrevibacterium gyesilva]MCW3475545.1 xanthine dehydrogenase family protein molybdopterin-binding subunit [Limobrevibacterium gyesilva]